MTDMRIFMIYLLVTVITVATLTVWLIVNCQVWLIPSF